MQPFLTRTSRTSSPSCSLSNAILSTSKGNASAKDPVTSAADHGGNSIFFRRLGNFYKRFYSAMSANAATEEIRKSTPNEGGNICGSGTIVRGAIEEDKIPVHNLGEKKARGSESDIPSSSLAHGFLYAQPWHMRPPPNGDPRRLLGLELRREESVESSVHRLVKRLEDHDRLIRSLETEINRRNLLIIASHTKDEKDLHIHELESLQKVYEHISIHFYDTRVADLVLEAITASRERSKATDQPISRAYISPFPHYTSSDPPVPLNKSLLNLFHPRVSPPGLILKISYNLLTSPSAPDIKTYNILIRGFTIFRINSLAHIVLESMVERGLSLDEYSVVAVINLCIKSADYGLYKRVIHIMHSQPRLNFAELEKSKMVLEQMINGAAKFGQAERAKMYIRALRRGFPESPELSPYLLTSLLKLWTEKQKWLEGKDVWSRMKALDEAALQQGKPYVTDLRTYRQMLYLCKACGKTKKLERTLKEAEERGWNANVVWGPAKKTKGMHVTSEVKVPRLAEISKMYGRYTAKKKDQPPDDSQSRYSLLKLLESAYDDALLFPLRPPAHQMSEGELLERVLIPSLKEPREEKLVGDQERSKIWSDIISSRVHILWEELNASLHLNDSRNGLKPDLTAFMRGSE